MAPFRICGQKDLLQPDGRTKGPLPVKDTLHQGNDGNDMPSRTVMQVHRRSI